MARPQRTGPEPDLGAGLLAALQQALLARRLDVADAILRAIEVYDPDEGRDTVAAYRIVGDALRPPVRESRGR